MEADVMTLDRDQFMAELGKRVRAKTIYACANEIYPLLSNIFGQNCNDSVLREWAFQWSSQKLGIDYDDIYNRWLA